jgi:hypothetical protein
MSETDDRIGAVSAAQWAEAQAVGEMMRPEIKAGARVSEVSGPATEQGRRDAAALLGCDVADVHDVLAEARAVVQARTDKDRQSSTQREYLGSDGRRFVSPKVRDVWEARRQREAQAQDDAPTS